MVNLNRKELKKQAALRLEDAAFDPKLLALLYFGISLGISLLGDLLNWLLDSAIASAGGLSGISTRSMLSTVQFVLNTALTFATLLLNAGWIFVSIRLFRRENPGPKSLAQGFRNIGPVLRLYLLFFLISLGLYIALFFLFVILLGLLPPNADLSSLPAALYEVLTFAPLVTVLYGVILLAILALIVLPIYYSLSLAPYFLMDEPWRGAVFALQMSRCVTKGHRCDLFMLDLSYWWLGALLGLTLCIENGGVYLAMLGVDVGIGGTILFFLLGAVAQALVYMKFLPKYAVTYAAYYETLNAPSPGTHNEEYEALPESSPEEAQEGTESHESDQDSEL